MTTKQAVIGEQQFDSTNTPSQPTRAQRALAAAKAALLKHVPVEVPSPFESCGIALRKDRGFASGARSQTTGVIHFDMPHFGEFVGCANPASPHVHFLNA